jgi:pimeloyl-ACP methyl ester carboxylesterase/DNA-binding CsgD family transcriptional regulator
MMRTMKAASSAPDRGFAAGDDGVRIAYARQGGGPVVVRAAHWLSHLEFDWHTPVWRGFLTELASVGALVRYDQRGTGMSDREVGDLSFEAMVTDLEHVVDALELEQITLLGMSQGGAISIAYAVRHPERVSRLVLCGAYARGHSHRDRPAQQRDEADVLLEMIRVGWGTADPKFRRVFADMFMPDATEEQRAAFDQLQRVSAAPETAYRLRQTFSEIDVSGLLTSVATPTLVMHVVEDGVVPFAEGQLVAASITGARFVALNGRDHILLPGHPGFTRFFAELRSFVASGQTPGAARDSSLVRLLTSREREIVALVADGRSNEEIASVLFLSPRTVERHLSNVYVKLGVEGKAARAAAAAALSREKLV